MSERTPTCRYHCGGCGEHFTSLTTFDAHRKGEFGKSGLEGRHCAAPSKKRQDGSEKTFEQIKGVCTVYGDRQECTIWADGEARERMREVFAA